MKCPICGKELELKNKQIGANENGKPVFNEYAICRDCRKQWNLDKQRAKKAAAKKTAQKTEAAAKPASKGDAAAGAPVARAATAKPAPEKPVSEKPTPAKPAAKKPAPAKSAAEKSAPAKTGAQEKGDSRTGTPAPGDQAVSAAKKPVKKRSVQNTAGDQPEEKRYSNIPPEKVRTKHENAARKSYEDMLATGTIGKPAKRKKSQEADETRTITKPSSTEAERKNTSAKPSTKKQEYDDYNDYDDDYYEDTPMFRAMRIILGILSLLGFGYFIYRGFATGMSSTTDNGVTGMTFVILALCLLVSALLYFITIRTNNIFAFLLPMVFYLGSAVFAFLRRGDDLQLFVAAAAAAVLAVVSLILAITSRGGDDYDDDYDDYDDAFEDDYADE